MSKAESKTMQTVKKLSKRWFIDAFGNAGERVVLVEGDYDKTLGSLLG